MIRSELEAKVAKITGAELRNGRWVLAGRDFSIAMDGIVTEMERQVADAIEPLVEAYEVRGTLDYNKRLRLKIEWSRMSRALETVVKLYKEIT